MESAHRVHVGDSRRMDDLAEDSVELVVTSPPYPMIEMWDEVFGALDGRIEEHLAADNGREAFELMHEALEETWREVSRVLVDGGIACVNVGDATRTVGDSFRVYQNHARVVEAFEALGFEPLPEILWRKPVNSAAKFMGSGMLPPNAYVTLEHEYVLVFRNGESSRSFQAGADRRYRSAYFWEERNDWFSDVWTDLGGTDQRLEGDELRERSGAFPFDVPYRLINMYSVYGDTVLDPFWGTGTTSIAAMVAGRNSIGYELEAEFRTVFEERLETVDRLSRTVVADRLDSHEEFVAECANAGESLAYTADHYDVPVVTSQETDIQFHVVEDVAREDDAYVVTHVPVEDGALEQAESRPESAAEPGED